MCAQLDVLPKAESAAQLRWSALPHEIGRMDWAQTNGRAGVLCLPAIAAWIFFGVIAGQHLFASYAVAGAVTVGFAAFQALSRHPLRSLLVTLIGIAAATWIGTVAGHAGPAASIILCALCAWAFGVMTMLGHGAWWVGLQWMIALLAYGSRPAGPADASFAALVVLAGGATQIAFLILLLPLTNHWFSRPPQPLGIASQILPDLLRNANPASLAGRHAIRVALAVALGQLFYRYSGLQNGYWTPMTAVILLKPDLHETIVRGAGRLAGTLAGAGLTTHVISRFRPTHIELGMILLLAVWGCYALQRVNYALFATCITTYVVLLLSARGLPEPAVAQYRLVATLAGAVIALVVHVVPLLPREVFLDFRQSPTPTR